MGNHEIQFEKIEAKEREWDSQIDILRKKAERFEDDAKVKIETQIEYLNAKLEDIKKRTKEVKQLTGGVHDELADKIIHSWIEMFTKIDNIMMRLKE